jgi:sugar (pentulose or hexulose) kinase
MTPDSANATFLDDTRPKHRRWSPSLCSLFDVDPAHLPEVIDSTEIAGTLLPSAAGALGAALLCAAGLGAVSSLEEAAHLVPVAGTSEPCPESRGLYDRHFEQFKRLYAGNRGGFRALNGAG